MALTSSQKLFAYIREKQAHRDRLLRELDLCAAVQAQGIAVDAVDRWGSASIRFVAPCGRTP